MSKMCSTCKREAPLVHFAKNKTTKDGLQNCCDECRRQYNRDWFDNAYKDPIYRAGEQKRAKNNKLRRALKKYSLTEQDYIDLAAKGCAICGGPPKGRGRYHFDHDHITGEFRGLLCTSCNVAIGHFRDDKELLLKAIEYLSDSRKSIGPSLKIEFKLPPNIN